MEIETTSSGVNAIYEIYLYTKQKVRLPRSGASIKRIRDEIPCDALFDSSTPEAPTRNYVWTVFEPPEICSDCAATGMGRIGIATTIKRTTPMAEIKDNKWQDHIQGYHDEYNHVAVIDEATIDYFKGRGGIEKIVQASSLPLVHFSEGRPGHMTLISTPLCYDRFNHERGVARYLLSESLRLANELMHKYDGIAWDEEHAPDGTPHIASWYKQSCDFVKKRDRMLFRVQRKVNNTLRREEEEREMKKRKFAIVR